MQQDFSEEKFIEGQVLFFNKPLDWTSFDLVNKVRLCIRRYYGIRKIKVGHAGTLDPLATGLVIICTGKATKQIDQFLGMDKSYEASIRLGATTPSYDLETEIDEIFPWDHITTEDLNSVVNSFVGEIDQVPPIFSAIKVNGRKAYDLARKGKDVELKSRQITIHDMQLAECNLPDLKVDVTCSKGTYIRSLASDLGKELGSGAHLTGLVRTSIGPYSLNEAMTIDFFEEKLALNATK